MVNHLTPSDSPQPDAALVAGDPLAEVRRQLFGVMQEQTKMNQFQKDSSVLIAEAEVPPAKILPPGPMPDLDQWKDGPGGGRRGYGPDRFDIPEPQSVIPPFRYRSK